MHKYTADNGTVPAPTGCTEITEQAYNTELAALEASNAQTIADLEAADQANAKADYDALRAMNVPEATARRLSRYEGGE